MNILVVNIGSTSFKFRLLDMADQRVLAAGGVEGVGNPAAQMTVQWNEKPPDTTSQPVMNHADAVRLCIGQLMATQTTAARPPRPQVHAVAFKAVHGGPIADAVRVTPDVLRIMEQFADAAPAHNPPYLAAMRAFQDQWPDLPLIAAFETGFHQTIAAARTTYAIPYEWTTDFGVRRYGFHGASHRYVALRTAELLGRNDLRIISCHLGGSSSVCAIRAGASIATSMGMTPQSGLPQNNRVGDFDPYALLALRARTGLDVDSLLATLATRGGLLGISGLSNDMREIVAAAQRGHPRAALALDVYIESVRDYLGAYVVALRGLDALVFTGGIGERSPEIRRRVCDGLEFLGIRLAAQRNEIGAADALVSPDDARVPVITMRTNEELIVARQAQALLSGAHAN